MFQVQGRGSASQPSVVRLRLVNLPSHHQNPAAHHPGADPQQYIWGLKQDVRLRRQFSSDYTNLLALNAWIFSPHSDRVDGDSDNKTESVSFFSQIISATISALKFPFCVITFIGMLINYDYEAQYIYKNICYFSYKYICVHIRTVCVYLYCIYVYI